MEKRRNKGSSKVKFLKPTLQNLISTDNVEHLLVTFEKNTAQHKWPKEVFQVAGQLHQQGSGSLCSPYNRG